MTTTWLRVLAMAVVPLLVGVPGATSAVAGQAQTVRVTARGAHETTVCGDQLPDPDPVRFFLSVDLEEQTELSWQVTSNPATGVLLPTAETAGTIEHPGGEARYELALTPESDDRFEPSQTVALTVTYDDPDAGNRSVSASAWVDDDDRQGVQRPGPGALQVAVNSVSSGFLGAPPSPLVIVGDESFADGLAASALGDTVQLTPPGSLHESIGRARSVTIVGGPDAVSEEVAEQLVENGAEEIVRIAGVDRFDTARLVAAEVRRRAIAAQEAPPREVLLASGRSPVDAAAAAQLAAQGTPLLLTEPDQLPGPTRDALVEGGFETVVIVGGPAVVGAAVEGQLRDLGLQVERLAGANRFETSTMLASRAQGDLTSVWLVPATSWQSALALGVAGNTRFFGCHVQGVVVYSPSASLEQAPALEAWLVERDPPTGTIRLYGDRDELSPLVFEEAARYVDG